MSTYMLLTINKIYFIIFICERVTVIHDKKSSFREESFVTFNDRNTTKG